MMGSRKIFVLLALITGCFMLFLLWGSLNLSLENRHLKPGVSREYSELEIEGGVSDEAIWGRGQLHYNSRCIKCHGYGLEATDFAPALKGISSGEFGALMAVIRQGNPEKGMPAWGTRLQEVDLFSIGVYLRRMGLSPSD